MFVFAEATFDFTSLLLQAIPQALGAVWPLLLLMGLASGLAFFLKEILPAILKKQKQAKWFDDQKTLQDIQNLKPKQFEMFCAVLFGKLGFRAKTTGYTKDGGVDVVAVKDGQTHFIQCKKYVTRKVTLSEVRDFYGAMADAGCRRGFFVATGFFTLDAEQFAAGKPIELINGERLMAYVKQTNTNLSAIPERKPAPPIRDTAPAKASSPMASPLLSTAKLCPKCGAALVQRTAKRGANAGSAFWGCSGFPKCRFTEAL